MLLIERQDFMNRYWNYNSGEHVTFLGTTGAGKTTLKMQLFHATNFQDGRMIIVDLKPRNKELDVWAKRFHMPVTSHIPISTLTRARYKYLHDWNWDKFIFRPTHPHDIEIADDKLAAEVKYFILKSYHSKTPTVIDADELLDWKDLKLDKYMRILWTRGRSMDCGFWGGTQRPYDVPLYAYSMPTHLFFARDSDRHNRDRLKTIGGIDPEAIGEVVANLPKYHWLYLQPRDGNACIVGP